MPLAQDPWQWFRSLVLPGVSLALLQIGYLAQITRNALIEVLRQDFIRSARAKGLVEWTVVTKHALSNAMLPILTVSRHHVQPAAERVGGDGDGVLRAGLGLMANAIRAIIR